MAHAAVALWSLLAAASPVAAQDGGRWAISAGLFDLFGNTTAYELGLEHRFQPRAFDLVPAAGGVINSHEGGYIWAGLRRDVSLGGRWVATPHLAVALFEDGNGKRLGNVVEFRPGVEVGYRLSERSRIAVSLYHLSNADLSETNPGSESLVLVYSFR